MTDTTKGVASTDALSLTLRKPVQFMDREVTSIDLREPRAGEMKRYASITGIAGSIAAVSTIAGLPESVIGQLVARDINDAVAYLESFTLIGPDVFGDDLPTELIIELQPAIEHLDQRYTQLVLREPTAAQMIDWDRADGIEADLTIISAVSGIPIAALDKLGARDLVEAGAYLVNFLEPGPSAGVR